MLHSIIHKKKKKIKVSQKKEEAIRNRFIIVPNILVLKEKNYRNICKIV